MPQRVIDAPQVLPDSEWVDLILSVRHEIRKLPEAQRVTAWLNLIEGREVSEIARVLRSPYNTTKANLRFALLKLRERI